MRACMPIIGLGIALWLRTPDAQQQTLHADPVAAGERDDEGFIACDFGYGEVTLPDGRLLTSFQCDAMPDELERYFCEILFDELTDCRRDGRFVDESEAEKCKAQAIADYLE